MMVDRRKEEESLLPGAHRKKTLKKKTVIFTISHSTLPVEKFAAILLAHGIKRLADVRTVPRSRHNPQFNNEALAESLRTYGIDYEHMPGLGGLRRAKKESVNRSEENASFRGFADYMQTQEFRIDRKRVV